LFVVSLELYLVLLLRCLTLSSRNAGTERALLKEAAMPSFDQIIVWIIVGLIGGSLAGLVIKWERRGFGFFRNLGIGLIGALIGGLLFRLFGLFPNLDRIAISLRDIVAAFVGALIVLLVLWLWKLATKSA